MALRYIIMGTGRSGTGWASRVLTSAGMPCSHEHIFGLDVHLPQPQYEAASSWLAVPRADIVGDTPVIHVVREPLACIRSLARVLYGSSSNYTEFARKHLRTDRTLPFHHQAAHHYLGWNLMIEDYTPFARVRCEDGAKALLGVVGLSGRESEDPRKYNSRTPSEFEHYTPDDFPPAMSDALGEMAERYGYPWR